MQSSKSTRHMIKNRNIGLFSVLALAAPLVVMAAEPAWWTQQKSKCRLSSGLAYNTWVSQGSQCNNGGSGSSSSTPAGGSIGTIIGTEIGKEIGKALFGDPESDARRKAQAQIRAEEQRRAAEEAERRLEEQKNRLLGGMIGIESPASLGLMGVESGPELSLMTGELTPKLLRDGTPESGAKGHRIVDCNQTRNVREKLNKGLPQQREAIDRTEKQFLSAKAEGAKAWGELSNTAKEAVITEAKDFAFDTLRTTGKVRKRLEELQLAGKIDAKTLRNLSFSLEAVDKGAQSMKKLKLSSNAGAQYGVDHFDADLGQSTTSLWGEIKSANKLFVESGVAEELGENLSKGLGPLGPIGFRAAKTAIDASALGGQVGISWWEREQAKAALQTMREQLQNIESRVYELDQDIAENCQSTGGLAR